MRIRPLFREAPRVHALAFLVRYRQFASGIQLLPHVGFYREYGYPYSLLSSHSRPNLRLSGSMAEIAHSGEKVSDGFFGLADAPGNWPGLRSYAGQFFGHPLGLDSCERDV